MSLGFEDELLPYVEVKEDLNDPQRIGELIATLCSFVILIFYFWIFLKKKNEY